MDVESLLKIALLGALAATAGSILYASTEENKIKPRSRRPRSVWVKDIYMKRRSQGFFDNLIKEIRLSDPVLFFNFTRMRSESFDYLLSLCGHHLIKTSPREAIQPAVRLMVTLRFLATGDSYPSLGYAFRIHPSTICNIVRETCNIIWEVLSPIYMEPLSKEQWLQVAEDYYKLWQLPNCLGSIDGKHIRIQSPANSGSLFYNYKKYFSTILLAVCDAKYNFIYVDIGSYGAQSDGGVLKHSSFGKQLLKGELNIPAMKMLPNTTAAVPLYFIGDEAFPLQTNLLRPYSKRRNSRMPEDQLIFNYRLSRARRTIENTLGIMVARFRIFHREINAKPETVDAIVKAATCLHNFIRAQLQDVSLYSNNTFVDREVNGVILPGEWRKEVPTENALQNARIRFGNRNATKAAWDFRDFMKDYFIGAGSDVCPWQFEYVRRSH